MEIGLKLETCAFGARGKTTVILSIYLRQYNYEPANFSAI